MREKDAIYDIEVYTNIFTFTAYGVKSGKTVIYEVSERKNDFPKIMKFLQNLRRKTAFLVGFNNYSYDYPVLHTLIDLWKTRGSGVDWETVCKCARDKNDSILATDFNDRFSYIIWDSNQYVRQLDLLKIHHFDNVARTTSLKMLEFNMNSDDIQELPFDPCKPVAVEDMDRLIEYNAFDVEQTYKFYLESLEKIDLRVKLTEKYGHDFMNANDTKIGKTIFQLSLERKLGNDICFTQGLSGRRPRQTKRKVIRMRDVVLDIPFKRPEFQAVRNWIVKQNLKNGETKDVFTNLDVDTFDDLEFYSDLKTVKKKGCEPMVKNLNCMIDGFKFVFGTGGLHGCVHSCVAESDDEFVVIDLDVVSYYPSLAITNRVFPEHLSEEFCSVYEDLKEQRISYPKGSPENAALKLALNGVYGDSNNKYSPFFDPQYTMAITVNGQLLLCLLCEWLFPIEGLTMVQANTDGITVRLPRIHVGALEEICGRWEDFTGLELESNEYSRMFIRDVNNYIAEYVELDKNGDQKIKRKGAYEYDIDWHQNHSALVIQKAVEAHALHGEDLEEFIRNHDNPFDFYLRTKIPRNSTLDIEYPVGDDKIMAKRLQRITRYYVSNGGGSLIKTMPPTKTKPDKWRRFSINRGYLVTVHNQVAELENVNFDFYIDEAKKLVNHFK